MTLKPADRDELARGIPEHPERDIDIDLTASEPVVRFGAREIRGEIPESTRRRLVEGRWDALGKLLDARDAPELLAGRLPGPESCLIAAGLPAGSPCRHDSHGVSSPESWS